MQANSELLSLQQKALLTSEAFWAFSVSYYQQPEIQPRLLELQNTYMGNINLALCLIWLDKLSLHFLPSALPLLQHSLHSTDRLLFPYRKLRKKIKRSSSNALYQEALQFELILEQQQQVDLIEELQRIPLYTKNESSHTNPRLISHYCDLLGANSLASMFPLSQ